MKNTFLTGPFLQGYSSVFEGHSSPEKKISSFSPEALADRFKQRAMRFRDRSKGYTFGIQIGMATALILTWFAFQLPVSSGSDFEIVEIRQELVSLEEIQQTRQQILPPPPPRPLIPLSVPDDELLDDEDLDLDVALDLEETLVVLGPPPVEEKAPAEPEIFVVVETMPKMKGGMASLFQSVKYPIIARKNGVEGNVIVKIVVDEEGRPQNPIIMRSPSPLLEEAALEAVMKQLFEPGRQRGRAVKVEVVIPVKFRLTAS